MIDSLTLFIKNQEPILYGLETKIPDYINFENWQPQIAAACQGSLIKQQ